MIAINWPVRSIFMESMTYQVLNCQNAYYSRSKYSIKYLENCKEYTLWAWRRGVRDKIGHMIANIKGSFYVGKYGNVKTMVYGMAFDSKKEAHRYLYLKGLESEGKIQNLECQPSYTLLNAFDYKGKRQRKITYVADFTYTQNGERIVEDVKGMKTQVYQLKKKLFLNKYGEHISFKEIY